LSTKLTQCHISGHQNHQDLLTYGYLCCMFVPLKLFPCKSDSNNCFLPPFYVVDLAITHAFPCRSRLADRELAPLVEADIYRAIEQRHLTLVGWYHSHPFAAATPTLRDIDAQLDYQIKMKGNSDASYTPCVGVICCECHTTSVACFHC